MLIMNVPLFDIKRQNEHIRHLAIEKFSEIFDSGKFILGDEVENFEKNISDYLGVKHAIGVSSGTDALLVALMALNICPGDEVICPSFTFFATAGCITRLGATPIFVDIDTTSFNISIDDIRKKISSRTKAIIPVHLFGQMAEIESIISLANEHNIAVIEDCAQSFGATRNGRQSGTIGTIGCFSFFPSKNLGGFGDAGLVCTNDDNIAEQIKILRMHGMKPQYHHHYIGGNFRIDTLQAGLLSLKLPFIDEYINNRRKNADYYAKMLSNCENIILPTETDKNFHTWNQFTIMIKNNKRDDMLQTLRQYNIGCNVYYPIPLDRQECFIKYQNNNELTANAGIVANDVISLPIFPELRQDEIEYVCEVILSTQG